MTCFSLFAPRNQRFCSRFLSIASLLLVGWLAALPGMGATVPVLAPDFSVFDSLNSTPKTDLYRAFTFNLPDPILVQNGFPGVSVTDQGLNTNYIQFVEGDGGVATVSFSGLFWAWPLSKLLPIVKPCDGGRVASGTGNVALDAIVNLHVMDTASVGDELSQVVVPRTGNHKIAYSYQEISMPMLVKGGALDGKVIHLKGEIAYGIESDTSDPTRSEGYVGDVLIAVEWGIDPLGNHECVLARVLFSAGASTSDPDCLPLKNVITQKGFGQSVAEYFNPKWNDLLGEIKTGVFQLQGAIPELLYLYDFSGNATIRPERTLPAGTLDVNKVAPFDLSNHSTNMTFLYTNAYPHVNQYDAGMAYGLPARFHPPNPVPPPTGYTKGGNACGPTSLGMALFNEGVDPVDHASVYDNCTPKGMAAPLNSANEFDFFRAYTWLSGTNKSTIGGVSHHYQFSAPSPLPSGRRVSLRYAEGDSPDASKIAKSWDAIDTVLDQRQPVVCRTDLGLAAAPTPGGGHCILLLGRSHSDRIAEAYGTSGDYYIVADPAGHYFGNSKSKNHYGLMRQCADQFAGANYGGWFAMYPKELLRPRISDNGTGGYRVTALTIGQTFAKSLADVTVHSPVSIVVTDPSGHRCGLQPDGTRIDETTNAFFEPAVLDEEEEGTSRIDPDGPKRVEFELPDAGAYQVELVGTGDGPYELEWEVIRDGQTVDYQLLSGTIALNEHRSYTFQVSASPTDAAPRINASLAGTDLVLSWTATGFLLESTTTAAIPNSWAAVQAQVNTSGDQNTVNVPVQSGARFYRLKK